VTYAPATLLNLRTYLISQTHLSPISLGIVGDAAHAKRATYHNGWDRFFASGLDTCAENYTICMVRDRSLPHTNAAAAIDIGANSSTFPLTHLRAMSKLLVKWTQAGAPGTKDIREIIYSPDGKVVLRWDRKRGQGSAPRPGEADSTHLFHTHISWHRDSENRTKIPPFRRFFQPDVPPPEAAYSAAISCAVQTYNSHNEPRGEISGLTVKTTERIKMDGQWRYRIMPGYKYAGRYLPADSCVEYTPL
jgi:hypothetical protein